jgi:hypothetical protein
MEMAAIVTQCCDNAVLVHGTAVESYCECEMVAPTKSRKKRTIMPAMLFTELLEASWWVASEEQETTERLPLGNDGGGGGGGGGVPWRPQSQSSRQNTNTN